jgi:metal-responsive CopG/Arc/MetJ family transcriptional regulator
MSISRSRASRVFTISFPEDLAQQVEAVAQEESRNISELFRETFRRYQLDRLHRSLDVGRAEARARGGDRYTENDIEQLVHEVRVEVATERKERY